MVLRRVLLEDYGLILPFQTRREKNQLLDRDQGTSVPSVPLDQGHLDIIRQLGRLLEFITYHHPCAVQATCFFQTYVSHISTPSSITSLCYSGHTEATHPLSPAQGFTCIETNVIVFPVGNAFESSFPKAHRERIVDCIGTKTTTSAYATSVQDGHSLCLPSRSRT